jgi:cytochrome bd ubiquinol oxidase subunit II
MQRSSRGDGHVGRASVFACIPRDWHHGGRLLAFSVLLRWDEVPFLMVTVIFLCAFGTLALSFWPYMIPFVLTIEEAAAPQSSLAFMFWGEGLFVFPLMLLYTAISYGVFRGKVRPTAGHY